MRFLLSPMIPERLAPTRSADCYLAIVAAIALAAAIAALAGRALA